MTFQKGLIAGGVVGRTVGNPKGLTLSRRSARRAYEKEHIKLTEHFARRFNGLRPEALTESERAEVLAAYDKLSRKWGIWE